MGTQMLQRRGTSAEWAASNVVLGEGEIGFDKTTGELRVGDGVTAWNSLTSTDIILPRSVLDTLYSPIGAIPVSVVDAAGDLIVGSGADAVTRLPKGTSGQRLTIDGSGNLVWADLPAVANPFSPIDAAGDLLVGTGPDAVGRLAKGANGQVLTIDGAGNLVWSTPSATDTSKVAKAGDTMTGTLSVPYLIVDGPNGTSRGRLDNDEDGVLRARSGDGSAWVPFKAGALYDNGNRAYSASNPPPVSGMSVLSTDNAYISSNVGAALGSFVAPANGRVVVRASTPQIAGGHNCQLSINNSTWYTVTSSGSGSASGGSPAVVVVPNSYGQVGFYGLTPGATYTLYGKNTYNNGMYCDFSVEG